MYRRNRPYEYNEVNEASEETKLIQDRIENASGDFNSLLQQSRELNTQTLKQALTKILKNNLENMKEEVLDGAWVELIADKVLKEFDRLAVQQEQEQEQVQQKEVIQKAVQQKVLKQPEEQKEQVYLEESKNQINHEFEEKKSNVKIERNEDEYPFDNRRKIAEICPMEFRNPLDSDIYKGFFKKEKKEKTYSYQKNKKKISYEQKKEKELLEASKPSTHGRYIPMENNKLIANSNQERPQRQNFREARQEARNRDPQTYQNRPRDPPPDPAPTTEELKGKMDQKDDPNDQKQEPRFLNPEYTHEDESNNENSHQDQDIHADQDNEPEKTTKQNHHNSVSQTENKEEITQPQKDQTQEPELLIDHHVNNSEGSSSTLKEDSKDSSQKDEELPNLSQIGQQNQTQEEKVNSRDDSKPESCESSESSMSSIPEYFEAFYASLPNVFEDYEVEKKHTLSFGQDKVCPYEEIEECLEDDDLRANIVCFIPQDFILKAMLKKIKKTCHFVFLVKSEDLAVALTSLPKEFLKKVNNESDLETIETEDVISQMESEEAFLVDLAYNKEFYEDNS
ncbi:unnamed protein product [Moneuplotes crassus]|uniref:Uncharacterized protein n=1 Tax=Euplotes crassus TaxID=5936 RepID=A0AAD1U7Z8_EUPCR|nr:unnamed protein product [Moneuplotes crassus]